MPERKILVVDDDTDAVEFVKAVLANEETRVLSARNGDVGFKLAKAERPDLIILDVQMPKKDGFTTFAELKADEATQDIPVIMLTGVGDKSGVRFSREDMGDFLGIKPDAYVEKPVDAESLEKTVKQVLSR